jgi:hypothetical protein
VFEDGELLVEVSAEEGEEGYDGQDDVGDEGVCAGGKCGCEAVKVLVCGLKHKRRVEDHLTSNRQQLRAHCHGARSC